MGPDKVLNFLTIFNCPRKIYDTLLKMKNEEMKINFFNIAKFLNENNKELSEENFNFYSVERHYKDHIKKRPEYNFFDRNEKKLIERLVLFFGK